MKRRGFLQFLAVGFFKPLENWSIPTMPAVASADDSTKPLDNDLVNYPASQGAAEFRTLKDKVNKLFLASQVDTIGEFLIVTNNRGMYVGYLATPVNTTSILYGYACNVTRTGKDNHVVGAQLNAWLADNVTLVAGQVFGCVSQVATGVNNSVATLVGNESAVCNLWNANTNSKVGYNPVFKNRSDGAAAAASGLGANKYNGSAWAIYISSQQRGTDGAFCGWMKGIYFDEWSMDLWLNGATNTRGYAIDAFSLHYDGGSDARTAYRVDAVLRMRTLQSIMWDDGVGARCRMYMDPFTGRFTIANDGTIYGGAMTERFGVDMNTGGIYKNGVLVL
jgi:hypothetical protein